MPPLRTIVAFALALGAAAVGGGLSTWLAGKEVYGRPEMLGYDFWLQSDEPMRATEVRPIVLPHVFGDFDLVATVELHEDSELDVLMRIVEPRERRLESGSDMAGFHGRFHVLRLSARTAGPPYRTREQALFDDETRGGALVRGGVPATLLIQGRGRRIRANVAGQWLPWTTATDAHGSFVLATRGGPCLFHYLKVRRIAEPPQLLDRLGAIGERLGLFPARRSAVVGVGLLCLLTWLLLAASGTPPWRLLLGAAVLPAGGWFVGRALTRHLLPWAELSSAGILIGGALALPLAVALAWRHLSSMRVALGLLLSFAMVEAFARVERPRLEPLEDPRLRLYFGPESGPATVDALIGQLHSRVRVQTLETQGPPLLFVGGGLIFEAGPGMFVGAGDVNFAGLRTTLQLRRQLDMIELDTVTLPTVEAHALQQLLLLRRFYFDRFTPKAIVFGVGPFELSGEEMMAPRQLLDEVRAGRLPTAGPSVALDLFRAVRGGATPVSTVEDLQRTIREVHELCRQHSIPLVLVGRADTPEPAQQAVAEVARELEIAYDPGFVTADDKPRVESVVRYLADALR